MVTIHFLPKEDVPMEQLKYAVIVAKYHGRWIFCRHKKRNTWEVPGGHREPNEIPYETARRELHEETGATEYSVHEVCVYGVEQHSTITYGMLCFAEVETLGTLPPEMEIGEIQLCTQMPAELTYPEIQPDLLQYVQNWLSSQARCRNPYML